MSLTPGRMFDWLRTKSNAPTATGSRRPAALKTSLKKPKFWTWHHLFILFCYTYILGIVTSMYLYRIPTEHLATGYGVLGAVAFAAAVTTALKREHRASAVAVAGLAIALGMVNHARTLDTSDPDHLVHFARQGFDEDVRLIGVVSSDPDIRERYTNLVVAPVSIETEDGRTITPSGGSVMVRLYPDSLDSYGDYVYGDQIEINAPLVIPRGASNPGAFDYRKWLIERQGCYATMQIRRNSEIKLLGSEEPGFLMRFSLHMKDKILESIRLSMPYPESSFLGGVTLGLKGGVTQKMRMEFQSTGIAHVLAVSGLHVGFVAVLLVMLSYLFRLPDKLHPVFIMAGLVVFTIITGSSPATVRASIMFSMFICIRYYLVGFGLVASTLLTIPTAALAILLLNPLLVMDASFLLSFGAVLSLGLLTWPIQQLFNRLFVGFRLLAAVATVAFITFMAHAHWELFFERSTAIPIFSGLGLLWLAAAALQAKFPKAVPWTFTSIHPWVGSFIAAQVAINLGNSPLFALYFNRLSISGWYANFIAIPLCGIIVQLGILAGLLYTIPVIGPYLATLINAGNYLFCAFFLKSATFFASHFPYPYVSTPSAEFSAWFYGLLAVFVWHRPIWHRIKTVHTWWVYRKDFPEVQGRLRAALAFSGAVLLLPAAIYLREEPSPERLRLAILDVGQGGATIIQTPNEKAVLIDGGPHDRERGFNSGQSTVAPALSTYGVGVLDQIVLTSLGSDHIGGLEYLCKEFHVKEIVDCLPVEMASSRSTWKEFSRAVWRSSYRDLLDDRNGEADFESYRGMLTAAEAEGARRRHPEGGKRTIFEEKAEGGPIRIHTFAVEEPGATQRTSLVRIEWADFSALVAGNLTENELARAAAEFGDELEADILVLPSHGKTFESSFFEAVAPRYVVTQKRMSWRPRDPTEAEARLRDFIAKNGIRSFETGRDGAIEVESDGSRFSIRPYSEQR